MHKNKFTFGDFLSSQTESTELSPGIQSPGVLHQNLEIKVKAISPLLNFSNKNKEEEFENSIIEHVTSPETLKDISQVVGTPLDQETEDQFVERSMENLKAYLLKKFS